MELPTNKHEACAATHRPRWYPNTYVRIMSEPHNSRPRGYATTYIQIQNVRSFIPTGRDDTKLHINRRRSYADTYQQA